MKEPARLVSEFGPFRLEPTERRLFCQDQIVPLTPKALDLLTVFVEQSDHLIDKETLLKAVWEESFVEEANLAYTVSALRKALGDTSEPHRYIATVPKRGIPLRRRRALQQCRRHPRLGGSSSGPIAASRCFGRGRGSDYRGGVHQLDDTPRKRVQ